MTDPESRVGDALPSHEAPQEFCFRAVGGRARGELGMRPVVVAGRGPSGTFMRHGAPSRAGAHATAHLAPYRIALNPRRGDPAADAAVALDPQWFDDPHAQDWLADNLAAHVYTRACYADMHPRARRLVPPMVGAFPHNATLHDSELRWPFPGEGPRAHDLAGIWGVALALYLTRGLVVLTGCDLHGLDAGGKPYAHHNAVELWRNAASCWRAPLRRTDSPADGPYHEQTQAQRALHRVAVSPTMTGPLVPMLAAVNTAHRSPDEWCVVAGGPSLVEGMAQRHWAGRRVATCNGGLAAILDPDVYICTDIRAQELYRQDYEAAAQRGIETLIGQKAVGYRGDDALYHGRCAGVLCARVAAERGARAIHLVGLDGWGEQCPEYWSEKHQKYIAPSPGASEAQGAALHSIEVEYGCTLVWHCDGPTRAAYNARRADLAAGRVARGDCMPKKRRP